MIPKPNRYATALQRKPRASGDDPQLRAHPLLSEV